MIFHKSRAAFFAVLTMIMLATTLVTSPAKLNAQDTQNVEEAAPAAEEAAPAAEEAAPAAEEAAPAAVPAAPAVAEQSIDEKINSFVAPVAKVFVDVIFYSVPVGDANVPLIVGWLMIAAVVFTFYFGFIQIFAFKHAIDLTRGLYSNPNDPGQISHFQALSTALSGTVGLGNIAGVAVALTIGGPGATFWMILAGLLGMASKFTECTLGVKYRNEFADGHVSGGPMYYLSKGLAEMGLAPLGKFLAVMFAICCIFGALGGGNMFQANQSFQQVYNITGGAAGPLADSGWMFGVVMALIVAAVIIGGITTIARITSVLVPFMLIIYVAAALVILILNYDKIGWAFGQIIDGAFTAAGVAGGAIGAIIQGFKRASFSNEAGVGSAAIAHSAVRTNEPITEGFVALLEPFIDTVVVCTMTALVIVISGHLVVGEDIAGVTLTSKAFGENISWFPYVLAVAVVLFAFSTMISWSYYGLKAWTYLFGESTISELTFKLIFCLAVVVGSAMNLSAVIDFTDGTFFAMAIFNIVGLYLLAPVVKRELKSYMARLKSGEIKRYR